MLDLPQALVHLLIPALISIQVWELRRETKVDTDRVMKSLNCNP
jgi:hypothetical protein